MGSPEPTEAVTMIPATGMPAGIRGSLRCHPAACSDMVLSVVQAFSHPSSGYLF